MLEAGKEEILNLIIFAESELGEEKRVLPTQGGFHSDGEEWGHRIHNT